MLVYIKIIYIFVLLNQNHHMINSLKNPDKNIIPERIDAVSVMMPLSNSKSGLFIMEIWKDIKGWEGYYQISNFGRVKSLARHVNHWRGGKSLNKERILKQTKTKRYGKIGYVRISLMRHSKAKHYHAHRLIALCLIPNPENKPCVNHINGIKTDNRIANLAWCTYSENERHSWDKLGKQPNSTCFKKEQK